jgi:iron complex outermembrane receptor protein
MRRRILTAFLSMAAFAAAAAQAQEAPDVETVLASGLKQRQAQAAKSAVPLIETPQAISVVDGAQIKALGLTQLADALRGVAGVTRSSTYGFYDSYQIRGFDAAYGSIYVDGILSASVAGTNNELAGLEQVEVLKGPSSMLYGAAPLGGIVNLVSKRPTGATFLDAGLATGSYGLAEVTLDGNARLTDDGMLLGRLNLVYRASGDFVDFSAKRRLYVAPALTWTIAPGTRLTLLGRYQRDNDNPWSPVTAWGTVLPNANGTLPIDFSINSRGSQRAVEKQDQKQIGYIADHEFSDAVSLSQTLRYGHRETYWNNWIFAAGFLDNAIVNGVQQGHVEGRYVYGPFFEHDEDFQVDTRLAAKFDTLGWRHTLLAGVDYRQSQERHVDDGGNFDPAANPLDFRNPDYDAVLVHDPAAGYSDSTKSRQTGVYLQDHVEIGPRLTLTAGGRYDWAEAATQSDTKFSPRIGATFMVLPGASLYVSWSKSFVPQPGYLTVSGTPLPPETGRNVEGGVKFSLLDQTLTGMVSVFDLVRQNVATADPTNPLFYVVTGEQGSRGVEVEGTWKPAPEWTIALAYANLDAKVTRDNLFTVGAQLPNVPRNSLNLSGEYVVPDGPLANLGLNANLLYNDSKNATTYPEDIDGDGVPDQGSLFRLPSYALVDLGLSYRIGVWMLHASLNNVFDKRYYPDACCLDRVTPGAPRSWRLSASRTF